MPSLRALAERRGHLHHVLVALAEEDVVADADDLGEEPDHRRGLAHGLAVGDLRRRLVEFLGRQAEQVAARPEGVARAGGLVAEDGDARGPLSNTASMTPGSAARRLDGIGGQAVERRVEWGGVVCRHVSRKSPLWSRS